MQLTRIEVNGYTDTSGTPEYNQRLSIRRAESVAAELVKDGVPDNAISIQGFGDTQLLVPTGPACASRRTGASRSSSAEEFADGGAASRRQDHLRALGPGTVPGRMFAAAAEAAAAGSVGSAPGPTDPTGAART